MKRKTPWEKTPLPKFPKVQKGPLHKHYDVIIVGAGTTGLSMAYFLKQAGKTVCVLERDTIAQGDTASTTAHLTSVTDIRLTDLAKNFGERNAHLVWQTGETAIKEIETIINENSIDCDFERIPGFLCTPLGSKKDLRHEIHKLQEDAALAQSFGIECQFKNDVPLYHRPGICFANQAKFHPFKYLKGLAQLIPGDGSDIFEHSEVTQIDSDPLVVHCEQRKIKGDYLCIATHVPLMGIAGMASAALFQTKIAPYSSYVIGATIPKNLYPEASYWDTTDPYYYLRVDSGKSKDFVIFGGLDHKTGQKSHPEKNYSKLETLLKKLIPEAKIDTQWSGQVIETSDGLPFIGEMTQKQFIATGFCGNGITFGTFSALMVRDLLTGVKNPCAELYSPHRKSRSVWNYVKENLDYPRYMIQDRLKPLPKISAKDIQKGEGKILKIEGQKVACSRDEDGKLHQVSAVCTHMGCLVNWNLAEKTWDCPCHGSRFTCKGAVLAGPAEEPLQVFKPEKTSKRRQKNHPQRSEIASSADASSQ